MLGWWCDAVQDVNEIKNIDVENDVCMVINYSVCL